MQEKPNDRPQAKTTGQPDVDPKIYAVVNGEKFPRPALETMFADSEAQGTDRGAERVVGGCACHPVIYCSCNKVRREATAVAPACACVGHTACSCVGNSSSGGYGCQCAPVH